MILADIILRLTLMKVVLEDVPTSSAAFYSLCSQLVGELWPALVSEG